MSISTRPSLITPFNAFTHDCPGDKKNRTCCSWLLQGLKELNELVASYQGLRDNGARGPSIVSAAIACARTCNLDKDIKDLPSDDTDTKLMSIDVGLSLLSCAVAFVADIG